MAASRTRRAPGVLTLSLIVVVALVLGVAAFYGIHRGRRYLADRNYHPIVVRPAAAVGTAAASAYSDATAPPAAPAASSTALATGTVPTAAGITAALAGPLAATTALGTNPSVQVVDAATASTVYERNVATSVAPASNAKLFTAAAALTVFGADTRFTTRVVAGPTPGSIVLVGGGDPTLSAAAAGQATRFGGAARMTDLAAAVKKVLGTTTVTSVVVDDSLFTGSDVADGWGTADAPSNYASPITATMTDAGIISTNTYASRSGTPDLQAGRDLATDLGFGSATVTAGTAPSGARLLGSIESAPVLRIVDEMLDESDDVIAEVLGRQIAIAQHQPASFTGAATAIAAVLARVGIAMGSGMKDASGLSASDRVPIAALSQVLLAATGAAHPALRPIIDGLPTAGWDGTLANRFGGTNTGAYGRVRAKTGTLSDNGVYAMAGLLTDADGRELVFLFVTNSGTTDTTSAEAAVDTAVDALVQCGCH